MLVSYVGMVSRSLVLVVSKLKRYYVFKSNSLMVGSAGNYVEVPDSMLELATESQVMTGRGTPEVLDATSFEFVYCGVVSGGKNNCRVLVDDHGRYFTTVVSAQSLEGVPQGSPITVDLRKLSPARWDQVNAGLGLGKLQRNRVTA